MTVRPATSEPRSSSVLPPSKRTILKFAVFIHAVVLTAFLSVLSACGGASEPSSPPEGSDHVSANGSGETREEVQWRRRSAVSAPDIVGVDDITVNEGQTAVFTVRLSRPTPTNASVRLDVTGESATVGTDLSNGLQYSNDGGATYTPIASGGIAVVAPGITSFLVRVSTLKDSTVDRSNAITCMSLRSATWVRYKAMRSARSWTSRWRLLPCPLQHPRRRRRQAACPRQRASRASPRSVRLLLDPGR